MKAASLESLSILIVNWNSKDYLRRCLHSIRKTRANLDVQVIVVDAASFDGSQEMIKEEFPEVVFIQSEQNLGFGRSNNLGFKNVTGRYLLLLNPDTELAPNAIYKMLSVFRKFPDVGLVGPRILNSDGSLQTSCVRALPTPINQALDCDFLRKALPKSSFWGTWEAFSSPLPCEVEAVSGACMLIRSNTFKKVGGFSPEYFMYAEDMDLCFKIRKIGLKVYHAPHAKILHHGGASSSRQGKVESAVAMREATYTYMIKNHGLHFGTLYRILQGAGALIRLPAALLCIILLRGNKKRRAKFSLKKWGAILRWVLVRCGSRGIKKQEKVAI